jgi:hypothetical protein
MISWRKSTYSAANGACVEVGIGDRPAVLVRNSNHPDRGTLVLRTEAVASFVAACQAGELDDLSA